MSSVDLELAYLKATTWQLDTLEGMIISKRVPLYKLHGQQYICQQMLAVCATFAWDRPIPSLRALREILEVASVSTIPEALQGWENRRRKVFGVEIPAPEA